MTPRTVDDALALIAPALGLEADARGEVLAELRAHLEDAVEAGRARGLAEPAALAEAVAAFGLAPTADGLRRVHAGRGTVEGVALAAVPVLAALALRWLIFAPAGTAEGWRELAAGPAFAVVAGAALLVPLLRFPRRRAALALWLFFWGISLATAVLPAARW